MNKAVVFAGTTEGYTLCRFLAENRIVTYACVATGYGGSLLEESAFLHIHAARMDQEEMQKFIQEIQPEIVLDATHPYAALVTENIRTACEATGIRYLRVLRSQGTAQQEAVYVENTEKAIQFLEKTTGNILLTTGSKDLSEYTKLSNYKERLFARVLSLPSVLDTCRECGIEGKHLIGMQGPFSMELNAAMLRQFHCAYLVTRIPVRRADFRKK